MIHIKNISVPSVVMLSCDWATAFSYKAGSLFIAEAVHASVVPFGPFVHLCLTVCLSICLSVSLSQSWVVSERTNVSSFYRRIVRSVISVECQCAALPNTPSDSREQTLPFLAMLLRITDGVLISGVRTGNAGNLQRVTQETLY